MATYFFAVIERTTKTIQEVVENLEFTTKSKVMSTLNLLRAEGRKIGEEIGRQEGIKLGEKKGIRKGDYKKDVIAIRNMTLKKFPLTTITEILGITKSYVQKIQKALKKEADILAALAKKQTPTAIAKKLKVSVWLVEVLQELKKKKKL